LHERKKKKRNDGELAGEAGGGGGGRAGNKNVIKIIFSYFITEDVFA
jgi:hypothetical protein